MRAIGITFFGDSFLGCPGLPGEARWPALASKRVRDHLGASRDLVTTVSAVEQDNTRTALERMQKDVQFVGPDILVVQFGTNDSTHWLSNRGAPIVSRLAFRANLEEMIDRARRFSINRMLFVTSHPVALRRFDINGLTPDQNTAAWDAITREVAAEHGCRVADVRAACEGLDPTEICQADLIHANQHGAALYAETVTPVLIDLVDGLLALENARVPSHAYD